MPHSKALEARSGSNLAFSAQLEDEFQASQQSARMRRLRRSLPLSLLVYNGFLVADFFLAPATLPLALFLHFVVVSPLIIVSSLAYGTTTVAWVNMALALLAPAALAGQVMAIYALNSGGDIANYGYLAVLTFVHVSELQRLGYRYNVIATLVILAIAGAGFALGAGSSLSKATALMIIATVGWAAVRSSWFTERAQRRDFLNRLRERDMRTTAEWAAGHDPLTGLRNRRGLQSDADAVFHGGTYQGRAALLMIDVDHFKAFNDRYGHLAGDECLMCVAGVLQRLVTAGQGTCTRYGGEEFVVLLPGADRAEAIALANAISVAIQDLGLRHGESSVADVVTVSIGVCAAQLIGENLQSMLMQADAALYAAKVHGRNQVWPGGRNARQSGRGADAPVWAPR